MPSLCLPQRKDNDWGFGDDGDNGHCSHYEYEDSYEGQAYHQLGRLEFD